MKNLDETDGATSQLYPVVFATEEEALAYEAEVDDQENALLEAELDKQLEEQGL